MKTITPALQTFLLSTAPLNFRRADLCTIELSNGDSLYVTWGAGRDIDYGGNTFYISKYGSWERGPFSNSAEYRPKAGSMDLTALMNTVGPNAVYYPNTTTTLLSAVNAGLFNAATVNIQTLFWPVGNTYGLGNNPSPSSVFYLPPSATTGWAGGNVSGASMGTMQLTNGQIGQCDNTGRSKVGFKLFDFMYILNRKAPPHSLNTACRHVLFDAGCTLNKANFTSTPQPLDASSNSLWLNLDIAAHQTSHSYSFGNLVLVGSVIYFCNVGGTSAGSAPTFKPARAAVTSDGSTVKWISMGSCASGTNIAQQSYPLGYVTFASGNNAGSSGGIKAQTLVAVGSPAVNKVQIQLSKPMPLSVNGGDTIILIPGCSKDIATCTNVYGNLIHIGNAPFTPNPELAQ